MCASNADHTAVVPLDVPPACKPGDRVWFGPAYDRAPVAEINTKKSKLLELILKDCVTDGGESLVAVAGIAGGSCAWRLCFALSKPRSLAHASLANCFPPKTPHSHSPTPKTDGNPTFKGERAITASGPVTSTMPNAHVG
jgi:hypothetical protein